MNLADRYVYGICQKCGAKTRGDQCQSCSNILKNPTIELKEPKCSVCNKTPKIIKSKHLYLNISKCHEYLNQWLVQENGMKSWTKNARSQTKAWMDVGLQDRCITRDLKWGVPVPEKYLEGGKVFYVWFQAPIGYISITAALLGEKWRKWWLPDPDIKVELNQFMGKDNISFHSIIFPATLHCTGQPYIKPFRLSVTQFLMYDGKKFSKSNNVGIFGDDCKETGIKSDIWRFVLLLDRPQIFDSQFTWKHLISIHKKYLINILGNLIHRILKYIKNNLQNKIPQISYNRYLEYDINFIKNISDLIFKYCQCLQNCQIKNGAQVLIEIGQIFNRYLQGTHFWEKDKHIRGRDKDVVGISIRIFQYIAVLISPYLPQTSANLLQMLSISQSNMTKFMDKKQPHKQFENNLLDEQKIAKQNKKWSERTINKIYILFQQFNKKDIDNIKNKFNVQEME